MGGSGGVIVGGPGAAGAGGLAMFVAHPLGGDANAGPINIMRGSLSLQSPMTGSSTL